MLNIAAPNAAISELYERDETAWLERMAELAGAGETAQFDLPHLCEYLSEMARRDKREVARRLAVLLAHLLKWEHQRDKRSRSWQLTIDEQRDELVELLESSVLRNYAVHELSKCYYKAVRRASVETELPQDQFPVDCPYTLDEILRGATSGPVA